jgi:hypothetical protein
MNDTEEMYNMKAAQAQTQQADVLRNSGLSGGYSPRRKSVMEELQDAHQSASDKANKSIRALAFLQQNPAFGEFIELIRTGCIGI